MIRTSRRSVLLGAFATLGLGTAAFATLSPHRYVAAVVREHFRSGEVSESDIARFTEDFLAARPRLRDLEHRVFGRLGRLGLAPIFDGIGPIDRVREDALTMFILGSTAMGRINPVLPIEYIAFPDPYQVGCVTTWS